ncbi:MAG TPA: hypothetical protein GX707_13450 [Epulopiscium sp.]|nr:hypothetical protein [Candidatus Epulonipiscium sp.]
MKNKDVIKEALDDLKHGVEVGNITFQMPEDEKIIAIIMVALKKQLSKKVTNVYLANGEREYGECPACGHTGLRKHDHECCWWCGQRLDWESDDGFSKLNK